RLPPAGPATPPPREDLAVLRLAGEPGRQVDHAADRGVVEAALVADPPERRVAHRDADPEADLMIAPAPGRLELDHPVPHLERHPDGPALRIGAGQRVVEQDHQAVAGEVLD